MAVGLTVHWLAQLEPAGAGLSIGTSVMHLSVEILDWQGFGRKSRCSSPPRRVSKSFSRCFDTCDMAPSSESHCGRRGASSPHRDQIVALSGA